MVQPTLQEMSLQEVHEPFSSHNRGPIHEERKLQIKELDEWRTHKPRTHDKSKLHQNQLNTFPNQLKVGDEVLLDAADPHIVTTKSNEEIPLTVFSIFPFEPHGQAHERAVGRAHTTGYNTTVRYGLIKSSKAHPRIGTKNSTGKGSPRLPCPAQPRP
ncbi:hypothetical protein GOBAR_AA32323 [Gossypium barbadense]|uniref:Uncharacterized protein n=1 Tax=Gossypium barbadense TaxID=3634 RepID=A0A2P5WBA2_GOSBA|nr:hypothetical protein GOBAR_AA32323 [Gossypium barbadense]